MPNAPMQISAMIAKLSTCQLLFLHSFCRTPFQEHQQESHVLHAEIRPKLCKLTESTRPACQACLARPARPARLARPARPLKP